MKESNYNHVEYIKTSMKVLIERYNINSWSEWKQTKWYLAKLNAILSKPLRIKEIRKELLTVFSDSEEKLSDYKIMEMALFIREDLEVMQQIENVYLFNVVIEIKDKEVMLLDKIFYCISSSD